MNWKSDLDYLDKAEVFACFGVPNIQTNHIEVNFQFQ